MNDNSILPKNSSLTRSKTGGKIVWRSEYGNEVEGYVCDIRSSEVLAAVTSKLHNGKEVGRAYYVVPFSSIIRQL